VKDFCKIAEEYCDEVLSGKRLVCKWVTAACERQQRDLARQDTPDFPYYFDREAANTCCAFLELFKHVQGDKAGQHLVLEKWQAFALTCTMGWLKRSDGKRKYRRFFLECPKGSGKSFISSCLALFFLCADGEGGSTCVAAARATTQARLVFDIARDMLRASPEICASFGLRVLQHSIVQQSSASTFLPVSAQGKSLAGKLLHFASCDELEFHRDRTVIDEVQLGCDKRSNSLCSVIQHPGENVLSPGYEYHVAATKILSGEISDERTWCIIYSCEGVDWKSPEAITMSNPNLNVSVYESTLREAQARAMAIPGLKPTFCSHNLGLWEDGQEAKKWLTPAQVESCKQSEPLDMNSFRLWAVGEHVSITQPDMLRNFVCGVQRTSLQEPACVCYCCKSYLDGAEHFYLFPTYFEPEANDDEKLAEAVLANFRNHLGYGVTLNSETGLKIKALAHDAYIPPSARIEKNGIDVLEFHKTPKTFSPVMDWLMSLLLSGRVHFADETLAAHLLGIEAKRDLNANLFPRRSNPEKTIDAALAAFYALRLAMTDMLNPPEQSDVKVIFIDDDGRVRQNGPDGKLVTVMDPRPETDGSAHPADLQ
jgi:phage terminase large subunit-like protein